MCFQYLWMFIWNVPSICCAFLRSSLDNGWPLLNAECLQWNFIFGVFLSIHANGGCLMWWRRCSEGTTCGVWMTGPPVGSLKWSESRQIPRKIWCDKLCQTDHLEIERTLNNIDNTQRNDFLISASSQLNNSIQTVLSSHIRKETLRPLTNLKSILLQSILGRACAPNSRSPTNRTIPKSWCRNFILRNVLLFVWPPQQTTQKKKREREKWFASMNLMNIEWRAIVPSSNGSHIAVGEWNSWMKHMRPLTQ